MWQAHKTPQTQKEDQGHPESDKALRLAFVQFFALMIIMGAAGLAVANTALEIIDRTGMSQTLMGTLFTSVSTSLPELVTALAAVRRGAVNLAIGNIMGGNAFDVLFLAGSDMFFRKGSIYHAITHQNLMVISVAILMTSILLLGLLRREKKGPGGIGFESALILLVYGAMAVYLAGG